jgi:hypothetical protein
LLLKNFIICDGEKEYARNLMQAVGDRKEQGFQLYLFEDLEQLEEFSRQKPIHIMLLGDEYPVQSRLQINADRRYILVKNEKTELGAGESGVYKYQSSDMILAHILQNTRDKEEIGMKNSNGRERKLIGVYSPIHRIGKTKFALELGREMAKEGPVLYLNLEEYSGNHYYFSETEGGNLADLLYYIRQDKKNIGLRISAMAGRLGDLDYIVPMPVIQDLRAVEESEWMKLTDAIFDNCIYKTIILDLGDGINGLYQILKVCHTVYTLYTEDAVSQAKLRQYTDNLRQAGYEEVLEHTIQKRVE